MTGGGGGVRLNMHRCIFTGSSCGFIRKLNPPLREHELLARILYEIESGEAV